MRKTKIKAVCLVVFMTVTMSTMTRFGLVLAYLVLRPRIRSKFLPDYVASHDSRCYLQSIKEFCTLEQRQKSAIWIPRQRWNFDTLVYSKEPQVNVKHSICHTFREHLNNIRIKSWKGTCFTQGNFRLNRWMGPVQLHSKWLWPHTKPLPQVSCRNKMVQSL